MSEPTLFGAFNARQLTPAEVGASFVAPAQYFELTQLDHCLLSGPRGSGKTTLLKMLTITAQKAWASHNGTADRIDLPFTGVYVPADVLWAAQVEDVSAIFQPDNPFAEQLSRAAVTANTVYAFVDSCEAIAASQDQVDAESTFAKAIAKHLSLPQGFPSFNGVRICLRERLSEIRGVANRVAHAVDTKTSAPDIPDYMYRDLFDTISLVAEIAQASFDLPTGHRWALCYDELEISPRWLRNYLITGLRSVDQRFVFKLSTSPLSEGPIAPLALGTPQERQDYRVVKLWYSGSTEGRRFCEKLTRSVLKRTLNADVRPVDVLGHSAFVQDTGSSGRRGYEKDSEFWALLRSVAHADPGLRGILKQHEINLSTPHLANQKQKDQLLRKIKPIVLLRSEFRASGESSVGKRRSRKRSTLYSGAEALYALSEGNPRWLIGMLGDMLRTTRPSSRKIPRETQAHIVWRTSDRFRALLGMLPRSTIPIGDKQVSLIELVNTLGHYFARRAVREPFPLDPVGSVLVDSATPTQYMDLLALGASQGAFIHVDVDWKAAAITPRGMRLRLSFLLAPYFGLPLRLYDPVSLSSALRPGLRKHMLPTSEASSETSLQPTLFPEDLD